MTSWLSFAAVGGGAACGAWLRWALGLWLNATFAVMPLGTLVANLGGGLLMGIALAWIHSQPSLSIEVKLLITTGFLGGLTTFSSFSAEVTQMLIKQEWAWALGTVIAHVAGSLLMTGLGWWGWQYFSAK